MDTEKEDSVDTIKARYTNIISVKCPKNGYIQYIDRKSLLNVMTRFDTLIELNYRPETFWWKILRSANYMQTIN